MDGQTMFSSEQIPYGKFAKLGISEEKLRSMPESLRNTLMNGKVSPLIQAQIQTENGKVIGLPLKLQMVRDQTGAILLMAYPIRKTIANDMKMNSAELDRVSRGEVIQKEINENGIRIKNYVQLDRETKSLMQKSITQVGLAEKLREMEKINDIELGQNQKQAALDGKPIELSIGESKVSVGVDLREPQGYKVVNGDMKEWEKQQKMRYDIANEGFMGYVMTDENRWQYQQVVEKLSHQEKEEKQENRRKESTIKLA
jgi:hypothetical protein